jgi:3-oxoacyl-[acyl-carrier protein] reductase
MSTPLEGRVALVTGSSRGIGAAIAKRLAADGARVIVNYHKNSQAANDVVSAINENRNDAAVAVQADASTIEGGDKLLEACVRVFGKLDILVLNAGVGAHSLISEVDDFIFDSTYNLHVKGPLFLTKSAAPLLSQGMPCYVYFNSSSPYTSDSGGRIIFISHYSTKKSTVMPYSLIQASSKGAIDQIARILAKDLGSRFITVNTVSPGPVDTELLRGEVSEHKMQFVASIHPQKRLGMPTDIAPLVAFLASPEATWISGQNIHINGVIYIAPPRFICLLTTLHDRD